MVTALVLLLGVTQYPPLDTASVVNSFPIVNSSTVASSPKDKGVSWLVQTGKCCIYPRGLPFDLLGKALYLRPYEYWSHTIKNLETSINACTESLLCYITI
jgi:hypothetical protein